MCVALSELPQTLSWHCNYTETNVLLQNDRNLGAAFRPEMRQFITTQLFQRKHVQVALVRVINCNTPIRNKGIGKGLGQSYQWQPLQIWYIHLLTPWSHVLLEKLTLTFITAFTSARHLSLSWARSIQSMLPQPPSWRSSNVHLGLPNGLFPLSFPHQNPVYASPLPHMRYMPYPSHFLYLITQIIFGEDYISSSSLCSFLHSLITSSLSGPNILLSTLLSNTVSLHSSPIVSNQDLQPYKTAGNIIILYFLMFIFLDSELEDKRFCTEWQQAFLDFNLLLILPK